MTNEELVIRIKAGADVQENMLQLWEQTKAFIHTIALHYQGYADIEDLEQEGYLALYDAAADEALYRQLLSDSENPSSRTEQAPPV